MATEFEFRLIDGDAPQGQIDVADAVAILGKLQELATRIGRLETDSHSRGRPPERLERIARLRLTSLRAGSTVIGVERVAVSDALDFDLEQEREFDSRFVDIIEAVGADVRPAGVTDSVADSVADLVIALQRAAPKVVFSAGGFVRRSFLTSDTHRETWITTAAPEQSETTVVGRLFSVNLKSHRLQIHDDVGNEFALPQVSNDVEVGHLVGTVVQVTGRPVVDAGGKVLQIHDAVIEPAPSIGRGIPDPASLDEILHSAAGPSMGGILNLTPDEADRFLLAVSD